MPKQSIEDYVLATVKGAIRILPGGSLLSEVFELAIGSEYQKKMNEWYSWVNQALQEIIAKGIKMKEDMISDPEFTGLLMRSLRS